MPRRRKEETEAEKPKTEETKEAPTFFIISGMSGAGKTFANKCFEDMGFYCVDNMPPALIPHFAELCAHSTRHIDRVSLVADIRGGEFFDDVLMMLDALDKAGYKYKIVFLDAANEVLIRRYKESRRRHPLAPANGTLQNGLDQERDRLQKIRDRADFIIDTSGMNPWRLKQELLNSVLGDVKGATFDISVISFGYKYGIPLDADLVFDVRFLPNPFYEEELKLQNGRTEVVKEFVMKHEVSRELLRRVAELVLFMLPQSQKEGKTSFVAAVGCTAGFHRSVVIAEEVARALEDNDYKVTVIHRDLKTA